MLGTNSLVLLLQWYCISIVCHYFFKSFLLIYLKYFISFPYLYANCHKWYVWNVVRTVKDLNDRPVDSTKFKTESLLTITVNICILRESVDIINQKLTFLKGSIPQFQRTLSSQTPPVSIPSLSFWKSYCHGLIWFRTQVASRLHPSWRLRIQYSFWMFFLSPCLNMFFSHVPLQSDIFNFIYRRIMLFILPLISYFCRKPTLSQGQSVKSVLMCGGGESIIALKTWVYFRITAFS